MKQYIIYPIIIAFLLTTPITGLTEELWTENINHVYMKNDSRVWGKIYSWLFGKEPFNKSYALVIGISDYDKWKKLQAPYYDAIRMRNFLIHEAGFDCVVTITNAEATKQEINKLMEETFPNRIGKNDRFLFYFSGHGTQRPIGEKKIPFGYLVLKNCGPESYSDMITMDDIKRWDRLIYYTRHALFVLDSCFSGLAGIERKSSLTDKKISRLSQYAHHLITAGTANEESVGSLYEWQGSLFTDSLLKALSGRADLSSEDYAPDGVISLKELLKYIGDRIDDESTRIKKENPLSEGIKMSPQISDLTANEGEFFFITRHAKNKKVGNDVDNPLEYGWPVETKGRSIPKGMFTKSLGMEFVLIPAGSFKKADWDNNEHLIEVTKPFYIQTTLVTREQWERVMGSMMGSNPYDSKDCGACPVDINSWDKVQEFIKQLNQKEQTDTYRLPTEAEWEYACLAGREGRRPHPVEEKKPNAWGLYMNDSSWELCQGWYSDISSVKVADPKRPPSEEFAVLRYGDSYGYCGGYTSSFDYRLHRIGLRVVRDF